MTGFSYKSYSFADKDPIIDQVRTAYQESGETYKYIEEHSGVTRPTLKAWFDGATKRPHAATVNAVLRVLGYRLDVVPITAKVIVKPTSAFVRKSARHVVQMKKYQRVRS